MSDDYFQIGELYQPQTNVLGIIRPEQAFRRSAYSTGEGIVVYNRWLKRVLINTSRSSPWMLIGFTRWKHMKIPYIQLVFTSDTWIMCSLTEPEARVQFKKVT